MQQNHKGFYIRSDFFIILNICILYNHNKHILLLIKMNHKEFLIPDQKVGIFVRVQGPQVGRRQFVCTKRDLRRSEGNWQDLGIGSEFKIFFMICFFPIQFLYLKRTSGTNFPSLGISDVLPTDAHKSSQPGLLFRISVIFIYFTQLILLQWLFQTLDCPFKISNSLFLLMVKIS